MRLVVTQVAGLGISTWVPIDSLKNPMSVGLGLYFSNGAVATAKVQHTFDTYSDSAKRTNISISRSTTTATVTDTGHGLSVGDSALINNSGSSVLDGYQTVVSVIDANNYTYTCANSGPAASVLGVCSWNFRVFDHSTLTGKSARADGNYAYNVSMVRLNVTAFTSGVVYLDILQGGPL